MDAVIAGAEVSEAAGIAAAASAEAVEDADSTGAGAVGGEATTTVKAPNQGDNGAAADANTGDVADAAAADDAPWLEYLVMSACRALENGKHSAE